MLVERYSIISIGQGNFYFRLNLNVLAWWPNVMDSNISFFFFRTRRQISRPSPLLIIIITVEVYFFSPSLSSWIVFGWAIRMLIRNFSKLRKIWIINKLEKRRRPSDAFFFIREFWRMDLWVCFAEISHLVKFSFFLYNFSITFKF